MAASAAFLQRMQCQTLTPFNRVDMFAAHVQTFSVRFNWIKKERPRLETVLMKYPRFKDMFMEVVSILSPKCRNALQFFLSFAGQGRFQSHYQRKWKGGRHSKVCHRLANVANCLTKEIAGPFVFHD